MTKHSDLFQLAIIFALAACTSASAAPPVTPHWGSLATDRAMMRLGPGRNFPAAWEYHRAGLPMKMLETYKEKNKNVTTLWRKVIDPDGATGWVQSNLLSDTRTAIVRGGDVRPLHASPSGDAPVTWRIEAGVVGKLSECNNGWCKLDMHGRMGYIEADALWGVD